MKSFLLMLLAIFVVLFMAIPAMILNIFRKLYQREDISKYFKTTATVAPADIEFKSVLDSVVF